VGSTKFFDILEWLSDWQLLKENTVPMNLGYLSHRELLSIGNAVYSFGNGLVRIPLGTPPILTEGLSWFSSVPVRKFWDSIAIIRLILPSRYYLINH
jgi:hypothetical protein